MRDFPTAYFVKEPSRFESLKKQRPMEARKPYIIEKTIKLSKIEYENFVTDLFVDRWFIEVYTLLTRVDKEGVWHCIFVCQTGKKDGILVMSAGKSYPEWAAYITGTEASE